MNDKVQHEPYHLETSLKAYDANGKEVDKNSPDAEATLMGRASGSVPGGKSGLVDMREDGGVKVSISPLPGDPPNEIYARVYDSDKPKTVPGEEGRPEMKGNVHCYVGPGQGDMPTGIDPHILRNAQIPNIKLPTADVATPDEIGKALAPNIGKIVDACRARTS